MGVGSRRGLIAFGGHGKVQSFVGTLVIELFEEAISIATAQRGGRRDHAELIGPIVESEAMKQRGKVLSILCHFDAFRLRTDDVHTVGLKSVGKIERSLAAKLDNCRPTIFTLVDIQGVFEGQGLEIEFVTRVVIGRNCLRIRIDHNRFEAFFSQRESGVQPPTINCSVSALRFFFTMTLDRPDLSRRLVLARYQRKAPSVLSVEDVGRLLESAPGPKYKAILGAAYGAGLRVSEVASLKVDDIDSERMLIRIEQGKGRKDRNAMLSPQLLALLRLWWKEGKRRGVMLPHGWLFPGRTHGDPISTRQINRAIHEAAEAAGIRKRVSPHTLRHSFATHLLEQDVDIRVIQVLLGHSKLDTTALYARVATKTIRSVTGPLERLATLMQGEEPSD